MELKQPVNLHQLTMPSEEQASGEIPFEDNPDRYMDIRGIQVSEAFNVIGEEAELLSLLGEFSSEELLSKLDGIREVLYEDFSELVPFDTGLAGLINALSSLGCVPVSSCNGGCFGDDGHEMVWPSILFHAPEPIVAKLLEAAKRSGARLSNADNGMLLIESGDVEELNLMALHLVAPLLPLSEVDLNSRLLAIREKFRTYLLERISEEEGPA